MRKTNKNLTKQILTLMLAFVMVFTGMGIGSWGVDAAWAGTQITVDGVALEKIEGSKYGDDVDVFFAKVDDKSTSISLSVDSSYYIRMVSSFYSKPTYASESIYSKTGWYNSADMYVAYSESGSTNVEEFLEESGFTSVEDWVKDAGYEDLSEYLEGTVQEAWSSCGYAIVPYSNGAYTITLPGTKASINVNTFSQYFGNSSKDYDATAERYYLFELCQDINGILDRTADCKAVVLVQVGGKKVEVDVNAFKNMIITAAGNMEDTYYDLDDHWNGKVYNANGFWNDMQAALTEAKTLFTNNDVQQGLKADVTEEQIAAAYAKLNDSIDALIPKTQANATELYEAVKESEKIDISLSYNTENLAIFNEKQSVAKTLLSLLFENGKATDANKPEKQDDIDKAASELKDSYSDDKMTVGISTQETLTNFLTKAGSGIKGKLLTDITLSGYKRVTSFHGELDGNGHAIIIDNAYRGLVEVNHGVIQNITVRGADLESGAAICDANKGLIENCHNSVNFIGKEKGSYAICSSNAKTGIIRNCYNTGKLSGTYVGGICGTNLGLVENCFNTGLIDAESNAGGIVWCNHNNSESNVIGGTIRNCYNFNVMHHTAGWGSIYGSYIYNNLGPICGDNERSGVSISATSSKKIYVEGTVENGLYLDTVISNKPNGRPLGIALSDIYLAQKKAYDNLGAGTSAGTAIAGWTEKDSANSIFAYDTDYYVFYDNTNGHFIAVTFDDAATSAVIDAAKPSAQLELCKSAAGAEKEFYLVKVPTGTKAVTFKNTEMIIDYANGYTNRYVKAYQQLDNFGVNFRPELSRKFVGTAIGSSDVSTILSKVSAICGSDTATVAFVKEMLSGIEAQGSTVTPTEKDIKVKFRFVGATKSPSGNYDAKTNKDSQYVTWIATRTYSLKDGSSVGDLLKLAIKESGIKTVGEENNYVSGVYAPNVLGNYYLAEFTNGTRSGWMYTVNGKHPGVGLNGYYLKDGDSVIWHYINDYSYEVSDWFDDPLYPNLGNASTWDPWLKVADVDPDKNTPTIGGAGQEEVKAVTTDTKTAATSAPTEVKVTEKKNADGTKETVAEVKVATEHQGEILKQAAENKSAEIILEVSKTDSKGADSVQLELDVKFVKNVADKTDADLTVNTENGKVTLDQETIKTVLAEAKGATITLEVTKVAKPTEAQKKAAGANGHLLKLTIKSGDRVISDFNKGKVKVVAEIVSKLLDKKVAAIHIADDGKIEQLAGKVLTIGGKKYYEFTTPHFSTFALVDADELGLDVAEEPTVDAKALTAKLTPVARSAKTAKKNVKVTTSLDKQDKAIIQELKDAGYAVKYRFYRSTKKAAGYKAAVTKKTSTYTNTSGKKGTKYYYKVQVRVYDANGKLAAKTALKQCRYATRVWSK